MGIKDPAQKLFYHFSPEEKCSGTVSLSASHPWWIFPSSMISPLPTMPMSAGPRLDPVVVLRMALIGHLYGIASERRLARASLEPSPALVFRLFRGRGDPQPQHSLQGAGALWPRALLRFLLGGGEAVRESRAHIREKVFIDSTLVPAKAFLDSLVSLSLFEQLQEAGDFLEGLFSENPEAGGKKRAKTPVQIQGLVMGRRRPPTSKNRRPSRRCEPTRGESPVPTRTALSSFVRARA